MRIAVVHPAPDLADQLHDLLSVELPQAEVAVWSDRYAGDADYAVGWLPPPEFFARQPRLKAFFSIWAGVERILAGPGLPSDLPVIRLEDAGMGPQMAEYCVCETLRWLRHHDDYAAQQRAHAWRQLPAEDVSRWPIGLFGFGVLGRQVASAFAGLGFRVNAYSRRPHEDPRVVCFAETGGAGGFAEFMRATRVLVLLAPLTPQTRDRFDREALALLPRSAYVINVARGELLVDEALIELLDSGHLAGAALDVFRTEPLPATHPFWDHPKIRVTPHVAAVTLLAPSARQIAEKIRRFSRDEPISGIVERARGY